MLKVKNILFVLIALLLFPLAANGSMLINVSEVAGDVVFSSTGNLDLTGASLVNSNQPYSDGFIPGGPNWYIASGAGNVVETYAFTSFDGPFGTSTTFFDTPSSVSGDDFFIWGQGGATEQVGVPIGYLSGSAISSGMVFSGATIADFTMIPGIYHYYLPNDTITLNIGSVPEPATMFLLGTGLVGVAGAARRKKKNQA